MAHYDHLSLPAYQKELPKRPSQSNFSAYKFPPNRSKRNFYNEVVGQADGIMRSYHEIKTKYSIDFQPHLIFRIKVNQKVNYGNFSKSLQGMDGLTVLSAAEGKQGYWVVFSSEATLTKFKAKIAQYADVVPGHKYEFFNAIDTLEDIPREDKLGRALREKPILEGTINYLNVELWRMEDKALRKFIDNLKKIFRMNSSFRISDQLITRSFALLRIKMTTSILEELLEFKEVARIDRPFSPVFAPYEFNSIDISEFKIQGPDLNAVGILIIDSGITANHPLLEKAVGGEENFQNRELGIQDRVGHGTAVAGSILYGDIEESVENRQFYASNWIFSAKVMYGTEDINGVLSAAYDEEKLFENQFREAIGVFLSKPKYNIKVVNISFGNSKEVFQNHNSRQFPLAALIDELAMQYDGVVFVVSAGNAHPSQVFDEIANIVDDYPDYLLDNPLFHVQSGHCCSSPNCWINCASN